MAFTTGRQQITPRRGTDSYLILFEQEGWDAPNSSGNWPVKRTTDTTIDGEQNDTNLYPYPFQPQVTNLGIVRQGTTIDASFFKGTPIHSKDGEGPAMVTGDLTMQLSGNGTGQILRAMLQDRAPVATEVGTWGSTDVLAEIALPTSAASGTVADGLTSVIVPIPVTVNISDTPTVTSGTTAWVQITGTNRWSASQHENVTWTAAEIAAGTLSKTTQMYFQTVTAVAVNGNWESGDYEVTASTPPTVNVVAGGTNLNATSVTIANASLGTTPMPVYITPASAAVTAGTVFGYVIITGTDNGGRTITDRVRYQGGNATDLARVKRTTAYFRTITAVSLEGFSGGTFKADAVSQAKDVIFTPSTALPCFWSLEVGKGNRADTYRNVIPTSTSINFSREEPVRAVCSVMGGYANLGSNISELRNAENPSAPSDRSKLSYTSEDVFSGWEANISLGNLDIAARSATFTVNHNLEESDLLGGKYPSAPPSGAGEREVILTIELQTDDVNDFRDLYDSNASLHDVNLTLRNVSHGAFPHGLDFQFPVVQITEDPDFVVADFGIVGQTLSLRAIYSEGLAYEFRILANYSVWYPVREYAA